jgi:hypothetical protein
MLGMTALDVRSSHLRLKTLRRALAASAAVLLLVAVGSPAQARKATQSAELAKAGKKGAPPKPPFDGQAIGTLQMVVSIANQHVDLYSNGVRIASSPVSTGKPEKPTPTGVFSVIEKDRFHRSNLYDDAPMYYMHRLTWSGVAMHEGSLPGFAASHGCIRLPTEFVSKLWRVSKLGIRVVVARTDVAPRDFKHPNLFEPKEKPSDTDKSADLQLDRMRATVVVTGDLRPALPGTTGSEGRIRLAQAGTGTPESGTLSIVDPARKESEPASAAAEGAGVPPQAATMPPAPPIESAEAANTTDWDTTGTISPPTGRPAAPATAAAPAPEQGQVAIDLPAAPSRATNGETEKVDPTITDPPKPPAPRGRATEPPKRTGQVAVFVSRKEKKVFVRQGFVPLFDMPVEIANPDQPLGTHVYTALGLTDGGSHMRWNAISMPGDAARTSDAREHEDSRRKSGRAGDPAPKPVAMTREPSNATQALDRVHLPQAAIDRISELLVVGSSLIISDQGLGQETGRQTEFIVLTK